MVLGVRTQEAARSRLCARSHVYPRELDWIWTTQHLVARLVDYVLEAMDSGISAAVYPKC
jgi:hypothetical protein